MTPEQIIAIAREAGMKASIGKTDKEDNYHPDVNALSNSVPIEWLTRFASLVAAHEREECAKVCDKQDGVHDAIYADAIRARSQA